MPEVRRRHHEELVEMTVKPDHGDVRLESRIGGSASHRIVTAERKPQQTHVTTVDVVVLLESIENRSQRFFVSAQPRLDATKIARALSRPVDREAGHATPDEHIVLDVGEVLFRHVHAGHEYDARRFLHILGKVKNSGDRAALEWNLDAL